MADDTVTAASLRARATSTSNQTVARYVASIKETCARAADQGRTGVSIEFAGSFRLPYEIRETVKRALEADGFKVTYYNGDQRDPCSGINVQW